MPASYVRKRNVFAVPVEVRGLPAALHYGGKEYTAKADFHITLAILKYVAGPLAEKSGMDVAEALVETKKALLHCLPKNPVSFRRLTGEVRHVAREGAQTLVVMVETQGLERLYTELNKWLDLALEVPPAHITLYLDGLAKPLEIVNSRQLEEDTKALGPEDLALLKERYKFDITALTVH